MKWLIFGAGAIGSVVGGLLARAGEQVWLLGRPAHMEAIRREGLTIRGILGEHRVREIHAVASLQELPRQEWDLVLVTVKSYDTEQAARTLRSMLGPSTRVVSLQNGLGNWEALAAQLPPDRIVGGRVIFGAELEQPGVVAVTVWGGSILLGALDPRLNTAPVQRIAERLTAAGLAAEVTDQIRESLWGKVIYNASLNPLSTLLEVPYGRLLETEQTQALMRYVVEEAYAVARAEGIALHPTTAEEYLRELFDRLIPATAAHLPSTLQDIRRGKRTEMDALNGALVRLGKSHGVPTPVNALLTDLVRAKETLQNFSRPPGSHSAKRPVSAGEQAL